MLHGIKPWQCVVCLQTVTVCIQYLLRCALPKLTSSRIMSQTCCTSLLWCCRSACFWHHSYCAALPQQSADNRCTCHPSLSYCLCPGKHAKRRLVQRQQCLMLKLCLSCTFGMTATATCNCRLSCLGYSAPCNSHKMPMLCCVSTQRTGWSYDCMREDSVWLLTEPIYSC